MGKLQNAMIIGMKIRGYSDKTIKLYTSSIRSLAYYYNKSPLDMTKHEIESYLYYLRTQQKSEATIHVYFEAIKYFYRSHNLSERLPNIAIKRSKRRLPKIASKQEIFTLLNNCTSLKYKTIFVLIYSAGLRVSEAAKLRLSDIDFERKTIFIRNGKNNKDRYTLLANETIRLLAQYITVYHPQEYVFYGNDILAGISVDCIQAHFKKLVSESSLDKSIHVHTLRHCFATHLLEGGTSIFHIMHLLGHASIQTTMIYLHMESFERLNLRSPIDTADFSGKRDAIAFQRDLFKETA